MFSNSVPCRHIKQFFVFYRAALVAANKGELFVTLPVTTEPQDTLANAATPVPPTTDNTSKEKTSERQQVKVRVYYKLAKPEAGLRFINPTSANPYMYSFQVRGISLDVLPRCREFVLRTPFRPRVVQALCSAAASERDRGFRASMHRVWCVPWTITSQLERTNLWYVRMCLQVEMHGISSDNSDPSIRVPAISGSVVLFTATNAGQHRRGH